MTNELEPSPAEMGDTTTLNPGEWIPLDEIGTEIYVYGDQPVDVAIQYAEVENEIRQLRREVDAARTVCADRERELLELKGPCSNKTCRLHYAHSGPCDTRTTVGA